jgi:YegS/Rv2252/BmrU family lipid kinase
MARRAAWRRGTVTRVLVIVNPAAGRGRARRLWPQAAQALRAAGVDFETATTGTAREAIAFAECGARDHPMVIAAGGDGTVHEVVNGLLRASAGAETIALAVLPLGSGDDFAKMIPPEPPVGGAPHDWTAAVAKIARGETRRFDAGRLESDTLERGSVHYFANGMDVGFGAQGAAHVAALPKWLKGQAAYFGALAKTLVDYPQLRLRISVDDAPPEAIETTMTAVMNGRCFGGSFWVCPEARVDDGLLDVMCTEALGRIAILGLVPRIMRGSHATHPRVRMLRGKHVVFESDAPMAVEADGELPFAAARRVAVSVLPGVLNVIV